MPTWSTDKPGSPCYTPIVSSARHTGAFPLDQLALVGFNEAFPLRPQNQVLGFPEVLLLGPQNQVFLFTVHFTISLEERSWSLGGWKSTELTSDIHLTQQLSGLKFCGNKPLDQSSSVRTLLYTNHKAWETLLYCFPTAIKGLYNRAWEGKAPAQCYSTAHSHLH